MHVEAVDFYIKNIKGIKFDWRIFVAGNKFDLNQNLMIWNNVR